MIGHIFTKVDFLVNNDNKPKLVKYGHAPTEEPSTVLS